MFTPSPCLSRPHAHSIPMFIPSPVSPHPHVYPVPTFVLSHLYPILMFTPSPCLSCPHIHPIPCLSHPHVCPMIHPHVHPIPHVYPVPIFTHLYVHLGITTDNPGVFRANPYPYPSKPVSVYTDTGYPQAGVRVIHKPEGYNPYPGTQIPRIRKPQGFVHSRIDLPIKVIIYTTVTTLWQCTWAKNLPATE